jgi:type II secretion system protein J
MNLRFRAGRKEWRSGVTLAELLVASVILSICLIGVHQAGRTVFQAVRETERRADRVGELRTAFDLLGRDIRSAVIAQGQKETAFAGGADRDGVFLSFATLSGDATVWRTGWRPALSRVAYSVREGKLIRTESSATRPDEESTVTLASGVEGAEFLFHRGGTTRGSWESEEELPDAVEVSLAFPGLACRTLIGVAARPKEGGQ